MAYEIWSTNVGCDEEWDDLDGDEQEVWEEIACAVLDKARRLGIADEEEDDDY